MPQAQRQDAAPGGLRAGELFVPFSVLPPSAEHGSQLAVRVQALEGLADAGAPRLSVCLGFAPSGAGPRAEKSPDTGARCQLEFARHGGGAWLPQGGGGVLHVALPPALSQAACGGGVVCRLRVTKPGLLSGSVLAASAPLGVPLPSSAVPLEKSKGRAAAPPPAVRLSIGRVLSAEAQSAAAQKLALQAVAQLQGAAGAGGVPPALDALAPARGWLPAAGVPAALRAASGREGPPALRLAVDGQRWDCVSALLEMACDPREVAPDLRSPLTAALERGGRQAALLVDSAATGAEARKALADLGALLGEARQPDSGGRRGAAAEASRRWEVLAADVVAHWGPAAAAAGAGATWHCDVLVLALERCPSKVRRRLICAPGVCEALWRAGLDRNLPGLARKLAVWIGLLPVGGGELHSRQRLLDVQLGASPEDRVLLLAVRRGSEEPLWLQVARVMVNIGASTTGQVNGVSLLMFVLEQADRRVRGFSELLVSLIEKIGDQVDPWKHPTILFEENTAECPICMETLFTSTPSAFVSEDTRIRCGHFFCFDCASSQYLKQQASNATEFHCPICRAPAQEVSPLPDIAINPRTWFQFLDCERTGLLDRNTVIQALEAMLPIDTELLRQSLQEHFWASWDKNSDNRISEPEFFAEGGLLEWVLRHLRGLDEAKQRGPTPPLEEPEQWFEHWDCAKYGRVGRGEALTALCEAARVSSLEHGKVEALKEDIQALWDRYAKDDFVSCQVFLKSNIAKQLSKIVQKAKG